jgi:predicted membrane-bound mannosyltransferase
MLESSLVSPATQAVSFWALGSAQGEYPYYVFFGLLLGLLLLGATATGLLALVGLRRAGERSVVRFAGFWAGLSIIGYPAAADLMAGWIALHVVIPLSIPAAVGLASVWAEGARIGEWLPGRRPALTLVVTYLLLSVGLTSFVAPGSTYNPLGQPSQMGAAAGESIDAVEARMGGPGTDIAYVGSYWESHIHRLPLLWYVERAGGERQFVRAVSDLGPDPPPVVVAHSSSASSVEAAVPAYECRSHERVPWEGGRPSGLPGEMLICVDPGAA